MADGVSSVLSEALVVETVLRAVYGRGEITVERSYEIPLDTAGREGIAVLGTHATNHGIRDVAIIPTADGGRKVKATGSLDLLLWCKGPSDTHVAESTLTFSEDIPMEGLAGMSYQNETASAGFKAPPEPGRAEVSLREGRVVAVVPLRLSLSAEVAGDARVFIYASPSAQA
ncbi:outer spore coat protein CotE [Limnochorda pilosa]|uniref:Uncharacterized protein n=1 Tax=Limnochorda pilosa TaxID=1555112 RepID=A0A0K2SN11_LIMPI|nr:outer spore coat protein CotE [Limnochorda pilosa]BAS28392.1 hypothetical protein LIP_2562 [Limnochorda pilosa]